MHDTDQQVITDFLMNMLPEGEWLLLYRHNRKNGMTTPLDPESARRLMKRTIYSLDREAPSTVNIITPRRSQ